MTFSYLSLANIPYVYGNLLPGGWMNLSGQTHVYTIDPDMYCFNPGMGLNMNAQMQLSQFGVGGFGIPPMQMPSQEQIQALSNAIIAPIIDQMKQQEAQALAAQVAQCDGNAKACELAIKTLKEKFNAKLEQEGITDNEKEDVNALLEQLDKVEKELKEQKEKLEELKNSEDKSGVQEISKKIGELNTQLNGIARDYNSVGSGELKEKYEKVDAEEEKVNENKEAEKDEKTGDDNKTDKDKKTEKQGAVEKNKYTKQDEKIDEIVEDFHKAINGPGTDNDLFKDTVNKLDEDNIIKVMKAYQDEFGTSFMKDFMEDANKEQATVLGDKIRKILRAKAKKLGIYDECKKDFKKINNEVNISWYQVFDYTVYKNFNNVIEKIAEAEKKAAA